MCMFSSGTIRAHFPSCAYRRGSAAAWNIFVNKGYMRPQQTIGPYRILSKLGEGGMGEVWRAADTRLGRDVAIKVLPPALANDAQYMARFEREARLLAALNHPNIAAIYGVEDRAI